jgi:hypothetical protein
MERAWYYLDLWKYYILKMSIVLSSKKRIELRQYGGRRCRYYRQFGNRFNSCHGFYTVVVSGKYCFFGFWETKLYWRQTICDKCGDTETENYFLDKQDSIYAFFGRSKSLLPLSLDFDIALKKMGEKYRLSLLESKRRMVKDRRKY